MMKCKIIGYFWMALGIYSGISFAAPEESKPFTPTSAKQAHWLFTGTVVNDAAESWGYFFKLDRDGADFKVAISLIDLEKQAIVFAEHYEKTIAESEPYRLSVGEAYLRFNPINERWVLGINKKNKTGFNFKIDMLKEDRSKNNWIESGPGARLLVTQTSQVNGYIQLESQAKEQFITSPYAWFFQSWQVKHQPDPIQLSGLFCQFSEKQGLYWVDSPSSRSKKPLLSGWVDSQNQSKPISSVIRFDKQKSPVWTLDITHPKRHYWLHNLSEQENQTVGFIEKDGKGFCAWTKQALSG